MHYVSIATLRSTTQTLPLTPHEVARKLGKMQSTLTRYREGIQHRQRTLETQLYLLFSSMLHIEFVVESLDRSNLLGIGKLLSQVCRTQYLTLLGIGTV